MTYRDWMKAVDQEIQKIAGVGLHDLPDCAYYNWYADDYTPEKAARMALKNAGMKNDEQED